MSEYMSGRMPECMSDKMPEYIQDTSQKIYVLRCHGGDHSKQSNFNGKTRSFDWAMFKLLNYQKVVGVHRIFIGVVLAFHAQIVKATACCSPIGSSFVLDLTQKVAHRILRMRIFDVPSVASAGIHWWRGSGQH